MHEASHVLQSTHRDAHATMISSRCPTAHDHMHASPHERPHSTSTTRSRPATFPYVGTHRIEATHDAHTHVRTHAPPSVRTSIRFGRSPGRLSLSPNGTHSPTSTHTHTHNTHAHTSSSPRHTYYAAPPPPEYSRPCQRAPHHTHSSARRRHGPPRPRPRQRALAPKQSARTPPVRGAD